VWGTDDLTGKTVALQGCGHVGSFLATLLREAGAELIVSDLDVSRATRVADATDGRVVAADAIYDAPAEIFAPCGLGGILNDATIPRLRVKLVTGGANNQLLADVHGRELERRGIVYVPDYVANAGGVLSGSVDVLGWGPAQVEQGIEAIYDTALTVLEQARSEGLPPGVVADRIAWKRVDDAREARAAAA
jgi:leucine dehydrogenase